MPGQDRSPIRPIGGGGRRSGRGRTSSRRGGTFGRPAPVLGGGGGWNTYSQRRKLRLIRTGVLALLVLILLGWGLSKCGGDSTATGTTTTTTAHRTTTTSTTAPPPAAVTTATAKVLAKRLLAPHYQTGATVVGGKILLIGGLDATKASTNVVWRFDPVTGVTTDQGRIPRKIHDTAVATVGGGAFAFGGGDPTTELKSVVEVKPGAANAVDVGTLPTQRSDAVGVTVDDGARAVIVGGFDGKNPTNDVLSTTDGTTFTTVATLTEPVRYPAVAAVGHTLWVFGGSWNDVSTASIQKVDLDTGQTSVVGKLAAPVSHAMAFTLSGTVFLAGGRNANGRLDTITRFDPAAITMTPAGKLPGPLSDAPVAVVDGTAYLLGGMNPTASSQIVAITAA